MKRCKATNLEILKVKQKLGLSLVINKSLFQCQKKFLNKKKILHSMILKISN